MSADRIVHDDVEELLRRVAAAPAIEPSAELFLLSEGTVVGGSYRVESRLGAGGMGVVYLATDLALERPVALKLHRRRPEPDRLDRLMREASVMARMSHPNVLTIYEVGHHREGHSGDSRLFVAMEYVDGGSVVSWSRSRRRSWRTTLDVFLQAGDGLAAAHAAGVVHRDFKPHNVLIDSQGRVRVADFGLARLGADEAYASADSSQSLATSTTTREGTIVGTPAYMAPEQWEGRPGTEASDQYSFCVSLYELLYGENPLAQLRARSDSAGAVQWVPKGAHRVPARVLRTLRRGLEHDPNARFEDMGALLVALRRRPERTVIGVGTVGMVALVSGLAVWSVTRSPVSDCHAESSIAGAWNDASRQRIDEALRDASQPYAETVARSTTALLDSYARAWIEEDDSACHRAGADDGHAAAQRACLRAYRRRFEALVLALPHVDEEGRRRAVTAAAQLPEPSACAVESALPSSLADGDDDAQLDDAQQGLDALEAAIALRQDDVAHARIEELQDDVTTTARPELSARFELLAANHALEHDSSEEAITRFDRALATALPLDDDRQLAEIAVALSITLNRRGRPREAERALLIARAVAKGAAPPVSLRLKLATAEASALSNDDRHEEAVDVLLAGLELSRAQLGEDHPSTVSMLDNLTVPLSRLHRYDEALDANARALEINRRIEGDGHPMVARLLEGRGLMYFRMGRHQDALGPLRDAVAMRMSLASAGPSTVRAAANLSSVLLSIASDRGSAGPELDEAHALLEPIARRLEQDGRLDEPGNELLWQNLGAVTMKQGYPEDAIALIERAISSIEANHGPDSVRLGPGLTTLASAQLKIGWLEDARANTIRAREIAIAKNDDPANIARVELLLGIIERDAGNIDEARRIMDGGQQRARHAGSGSLVERYERELASLSEPIRPTALDRADP